MLRLLTAVGPLRWSVQSEERNRHPAWRVCSRILQIQQYGQVLEQEEMNTRVRAGPNEHERMRRGQYEKDRHERTRQGR